MRDIHLAIANSTEGIRPFGGRTQLKDGWFCLAIDALEKYVLELRIASNWYEGIVVFVEG